MRVIQNLTQIHMDVQINERFAQTVVKKVTLNSVHSGQFLTRSISAQPNSMQMKMGRSRINYQQNRKNGRQQIGGMVLKNANQHANNDCHDDKNAGPHAITASSGGNGGKIGNSVSSLWCRLDLHFVVRGISFRVKAALSIYLPTICLWRIFPVLE